MTAKEIAAQLTKPQRRALLRKNWVPDGRSGGPVLMAQHMAALGLFEEVAPREYERTKFGHAVLMEITW